MPGRWCKIVAAATLAGLIGAESGYSWNGEEHRKLADSAFVDIMRQCDIHPIDSV